LPEIKLFYTGKMDFSKKINWERYSPGEDYRKGITAVKNLL
jgi:hypothetical protein